MRLGADPDQLEALARIVDDGARSLAVASALLSAELQRCIWTGSRRADVDRLLRTSIQPGLSATSRALAAAATELRVQSDRQRATSTAADARVLLFDDVGDGHVVVALGDLEHAANVAILVPGTGTTVANIGGQIERARALMTQAADTGGPADLAVVVWLGYDAPGGTDSVVNALSAARAIDGGRSLRHFIDSLPAVRHGDRSGLLTVIGHSYGSLVAVEAARANPRIDRVVVLGSPGLGVESVDELGLAPATALLVASTVGDPISHSQWFGADPTAAGFGAVVLDASSDPDSAHSALTAHSDYFEPGSVALSNLASVAIGAPLVVEHLNPVDEVAPRLLAIVEAQSDLVDLAQLAPADIVVRDLGPAIDAAQHVATRTAGLALGATQAVADEALRFLSAAQPRW